MSHKNEGAVLLLTQLLEACASGSATASKAPRIPPTLHQGPAKFESQKDKDGSPGATAPVAVASTVNAGTGKQRKAAAKAAAKNVPKDGPGGKVLEQVAALMEAAAAASQLQQFGWKPFGKKTLGRRQVEWWTVFAVEQLGPALHARYGSSISGGGSSDTNSTITTAATTTHQAHVRILPPLELLQLNDHMRNRVWMTGPVETGGCACSFSSSSSSSSLLVFGMFVRVGQV